MRNEIQGNSGGVLAESVVAARDWKVLDAVYAEDCAVLMVAHRLSTVINCDRILVMDGGCIAEAGTYDELMARNGLFARLVEKQLQ